MRVFFPFAYYTPEVAAGIYIIDHILEACAKNGITSYLYVPTPTRNVKPGSTFKRKEIIYNSVHIKRFRMYGEGKNPILRALRYLFCEVAQTYYALFTNYDVAFLDSTPPIQGLKMILIKWFRRKPIVYNLQDVFPDSLVGAGLAKKGGLLWKIGRVIENISYKYSDKIIVISHDFKHNIMEKGVPEEKIEVVYNWVDEKSVIPINKDENPLFEEFNISRQKFNVVYAGNFGNAQNIEVIIQCAAQLHKYTDISFILFGSGGLEQEYRDLTTSLGLTNVTFCPLQPYNKVSYVYSLGDVGIVSCKKGIGKGAMPSKTWSIMSAGTAVVANYDSGTDLQQIIESNEFGLFSNAGDVEGLRRDILKLYNDRDLCRKMGQNARKFIEANLTKEAGTKKIINILKSVYKD